MFRNSIIIFLLLSSDLIFFFINLNKRYKFAGDLKFKQRSKYYKHLALLIPVVFVVSIIAIINFSSNKKLADNIAGAIIILIYIIIHFIYWEFSYFDNGLYIFSKYIPYENIKSLELLSDISFRLQLNNGRTFLLAIDEDNDEIINFLKTKLSSLIK